MREGIRPLMPEGVKDAVCGRTVILEGENPRQHFDAEVGIGVRGCRCFPCLVGIPGDNDPVHARLSLRFSSVSLRAT